MSVQTSYDREPAVGLEGQIADTHQVRDEVSRLVQEANGIAPGLAVVRVDDDEVKLPDASGQIFQGVGVLRTASEESLYADDEMMPVLRQGRILVKVENAVTQGDAAFARFADGAGGTTKGAFRNDGDTSTADAFPGQFATSAAAGELAVLEVDIVGA